jgi:4-carboxymuconolactone decarboxylase
MNDSEVSAVVNSERYQRGLETLNHVVGQAQVEAVQHLQAFAPDLAQYAIEAFGDLYANPALDIKTRELATIAALTVLGNAQPQLKVHIRGALNVGCTRQEVVEVITQMYAYGGFPAALNSVMSAKEVFEAYDQNKEKKT